MLSHVWCFATRGTAARQAPLSVGFSRQEHWRSFEPRSPALQVASFCLSPREAWPLLTQVWFSLTEGGLPWGSDGKESARSAEDPGLIPKLGRSPGEGNGTPLQYSCLEDPMDRGAWLQSWGRKATNTFTLLFFTDLSWHKRDFAWLDWERGRSRVGRRDFLHS